MLENLSEIQTCLCKKILVSSKNYVLSEILLTSHVFFMYHTQICCIKVILKIFLIIICQRPLY